MLLQMIGFLFCLIVVGGLAMLLVVRNPHHSRTTRYIGFVFLFAGLGGLLFSVGLAWLPMRILDSEQLSHYGFFGGYGFGVVAGTAFGLNRAARHGRLPSR